MRATEICRIIRAVVDDLRRVWQNPQRRPGLRQTRWLVPVVAIILHITTMTVVAQSSSGVVRGDRLSGVVLPVEPVQGPIEIDALRAWAWTVDDTKRLVLEGDVNIRVGAYRFAAPKAVVWLNRVPSADGLINQIAIYFDHLDDPRSRSGLGVEGRHVLVTGSTHGDVTLDVASMNTSRPGNDRTLRRGEERLRSHVESVVAGRHELHQQPQIEFPADAEQFVPEVGGSVRPEDLELPSLDVPEVDTTTPWLRDPSAKITFSFPGTIEGPVDRNEDEYTYIATGGIMVEYTTTSRQAEFTRLTLSAERAVIFTEPVPLEELMRGGADATHIRGMYLEGNVHVAADADAYQVRSPKVYYDFETGQALMIDAVLRTVTRAIPAPIHARARELRQVASDQWTSSQIRVSTSEFAVPHMSLGARNITISQRMEESDPPHRVTWIESEGNTLRVGNTPILGWPGFRGTINDVPLRSIRVGSGDTDGIQLEFDLMALVGQPPREGLDIGLKLDVFPERGAGAGLLVDYDLGFGRGNAELYGVFDSGVDRTSSGGDVESGKDFRGVALLSHQTRLTDEWSLQAQLSHISDETFITTWREEDFRERREYETSIYLKRQDDMDAFTVLGAYSLNDFISNDYLLASRGYTVKKLPEIGIRQYGRSWFDDRVSYSGETLITRMGIAIDEHTPREHGLRRNGYRHPLDDPLRESLLAGGLHERYVQRADSRHEISMPTQLGAFRVVPFMVGRLTWWDDAFPEFSMDSDDVRMHGSVGIRLSTQVQRVYNDVENELLGMHRMRHIIEPSLTAWHAETTVSESDLPVYDEAVESLANGSILRLGVRNVFQTQRGGPGMWRSVDVLTINSDLVVHSSEADRQSAVPRFYDYRPEYSLLGDHADLSMVWQASDNLSIAGETILDLDESTMAIGSLGAELRHSPLFTTYAEYRTIDISDDRLLDVGWNYQITRKYNLRVTPQWDFNQSDFRAINARLIRAFPEFELILRVQHDEIRDETTISASMGLLRF